MKMPRFKPIFKPRSKLDFEEQYKIAAIKYEQANEYRVRRIVFMLISVIVVGDLVTIGFLIYNVW